MDERENKQKTQLSCLQSGPGPAYKLPSLTGYIGHDPSRRREPAYSMKILNSISRSGDGPGPKYNVNGFTNHGPEKSPAFSIGQKRPRQNSDPGPSPLDYAAEKCPLNNFKRSPAFSLRIRDSKKSELDGPGPIYLLPTCIGPKIVDKKAQGAFTIGIPTKKDRLNDVPGPGAYKTDNYNVIKRKFPAYSLKFRPKELGGWNGGPGPKYKSEFYSGKRSPMYSFGLKHSQCAGTPITEADNE